MKKSVELRKQLAGLESEMKTILDSAKVENRNLNDVEQTDFDSKFASVEALKRSIESAENVEAFEARQASNVGVNVPNVASNNGEKYSLIGHINSFRNGLTGVFKEAQEQGMKELRDAGIAVNSNAVYIPSNYQRDFSVTGDSGTKGGAVVETNKGSIIESLYEGSLLDKLGASKMLGLTGNLDLPKGGSVVSSWVTENGEIAKSDHVIGNIQLRPNRLATRMGVSNQMLVQSAESVDAYLRKEIEKSIQKSLDEKFLENLLASTDVQAVINGVDGGALTFAKVQEFVELAGKADVDIATAKYLINYDVWSALKALPKASGSDKFVLENGMIDGMPFVVSNRVPSNLVKGAGTGLNAMAYGDWSSTIVAGFGIVEILIDPYTEAANGRTILNCGSFWDISDKYYNGKAVSKDIVA